MKINGLHQHTIWVDNLHSQQVNTFDQRYLPHQCNIYTIQSSLDAINAISNMVVRGAPLIGVTAAYGMWLAAIEASKHKNFEGHIATAAEQLKASRPTAVNLTWAVDQSLSIINATKGLTEKVDAALALAERLKQDDVETCFQIGTHALPLIEAIHAKNPKKPVNILTHCNAGWLACIDWGTATSPIYQAHDLGIPVHVWVDETRPRNQGANLTAFELGQQGIPHTLIADNTGGHLMQHGMVDMVIVGTDRTTRQGDVANKIGTYLKALAANDNNVPFYVALPSSTIDWKINDGLEEIPIEMRDENEVRFIRGKGSNEVVDVLICPESTTAANYGFDVTPARLVTGLITERGICEASEQGLTSLFPEHA